MVERILLNILFVILPLIFLPIISCNNYDKYIKVKNKYIIVAALLVSFACSTFTIPIDSDFIFDFRFIPGLFASLYLGPIISIVFFVFTIGFQLFIHGEGLVFAMVLTGFHVLLSIFYSKKFNESSSGHRIFSFTLVHMITGMFAFLSLYIASGVEHSIEILFWFISQAFAAFLVVYLAEYIHSNLLIQFKMIKSEKMDIVSHLAASISHEVRNPLTTVRGFLQLLSKMDNNDKSKEYIKISIGELDRAEAIIRDYLSFAKPSENKIVTLDVKKEFDRMIEIMKPLANLNNVQIESRLQQKLFIHGEQQAFQQCFINIMKNSIEAMDKGGKLSIHAKQSFGKIYIEIKDTGIGMSKKQLERIGEPYFSTKGNKGTGLGMVVVFKIVEALGGAIHINSEIGKGTEMIVSFPIIEAAMTRKEVTIADPKVC